MSDAAADPGAAVTTAFVMAYRPYVHRRLEELEIDAPEGIEEALDTGATWLEKALGALLALPYAEQTQSPLEMFRVMMVYPTEVLADAGLQPVERDDEVVAVLPGDVYDLAPASSQDLGEPAWEAHLAWGAAKAAGFAQPTVLAFGNNLMDNSRILAAAKAAGLPLAPTATAAAAGILVGQSTMRIVMAFVDLEHPEATEVLEALTDSGIKTIAYGPHIDEFALGAAKALGADAMPRSRFFRILGELLPEQS